MNYIFFLPFLIVAGFGIYQDSFALETVTGFNYFDINNGDGTRTWKEHEPYVFDGTNWVPYIASGTTIQTDLATVTLNADGTFIWNGKFTDKIVAKYSDVTDQVNWTYPNTLNNDVPDVSWNGNQLVSSKVKSGIGQLDYKYILDKGKWKTQLEATNLSALNTKVFGFDQIIDLESDSIRFGGVNRNLDNFHGQTFDKQFLIDNKGKMLDLLNGVNFDFDLGFENLYSVTVYDTGANKSQLVFDYRTTEILMPNETLVIDPTFTSSTPTSESRVYSSSITGASCSTTLASGDGTLVLKKAASGGSGDCQATYFNFDVSAITGATSVTGATLTYDITSASNPENCDVKHMGFTAAVNEATFDALTQDVGDVIDVVQNSSLCTTVADGKVETFNSASYSRLLSDINGDDVVSVGIFYTDQTRSAVEVRNDIRTSDAILSITYVTVPAPDSITDLTAASVGETTASLSFTPPNLNGETLINYMLNVTTPQASPVTTFWMNGSASPFSVTGLTIGTNYSASASAYTAGGGNWTLANVLNFTTAFPTISCCAPTVLTASSNSATQIDLQWIASTLDNLNGYRIERETPIGTGFNVVTSNTSNTNVYYNNTALTSNIIYNYRVYGLNASGQSLASNVYDMTTFHLPDAVTDLSGTPTNLSTIELSWSAPTSYAPEILGYRINGTTPTGEPVDVLNSNTGTTATTATALNLLIGQEYSFRVSPITVHGLNASGNIWNGSTIQTFVIGNLSSPDVTNDDDFSIFFDRTDLNSSAIQLDVTYPNSYNLSCDFSYKYARINQTYSSLTTVPNGTDNQVATFTLINATGDLVQVRCWDVLTGDESKYVITIIDFPFLQQIGELRDGTYGTFFQIGAFDGVMLIVIFLGMVGLNRTTPIVGIVFIVITTLVMSYFQLITYPIIMYPALIMMIVWAFVTTRKDD